MINYFSATLPVIESPFEKTFSAMKATSMNLLPQFEILFNSGCKTLYDYIEQLRRSENGLNAPQMSRISREAVKAAEIKIIAQIASNYLFSSQEIIEIGAGELDQNRQSYLMQRLPLDLVSSVEPTEVNRFFINQKRRGQLYNKVNALHLSDAYQLNTLDRVIGSAVLDTLNEPDLENTLKQIYAVLNESGMLIHVTSLPPYKDVLLSHYDREDIVSFLCLNENEMFDGLKVIDKNTLLKTVEKSENLSSYEKNFLKWYASLPAIYRELILDDLLGNPSRAETKKLFAGWVASLSFEGLELIQNTTFYKNRLIHALQNAGFKILQFGYEYQHALVKRPENFPVEYQKFNHFRLLDGNLEKSHIYVIAPGYIYEEVRMHVIAAKVEKKAQKTEF